MEHGLTMSIFESCIDYRDIVSIQKIRGFSKSNKFVDEADEKKNYLYDFYIQMNISRVNGFF